MLKNTSDLLNDLKAPELRLLQTLAGWRGPGLPLLSNLATTLNLAGESSVRKYMGPLEKRGYVERQALGAGLPKVPRLTEKGRTALGVEPAPRVLDISNAPLAERVPVNPVKCGPLTETAVEPVFYIEYLSDIFHSYRFGDQLLVAVGDSMVSPDKNEESIFGGDRLLVRPSVWPGPHECVYVEYELESGLRECTLKDWCYDEKTGLVTLTSRNPLYATIERPAEDIEVKGVVLEVVRLVRGTRLSSAGDATACQCHKK